MPGFFVPKRKSFPCLIFLVCFINFLEKIPVMKISDMTKKKVVIVEDHAMFREGIKSVIAEMDNLELAGEAENGSAFLQLLKKISPDIVLMDIHMPVMDGIEATEKALQLYPSLRILVLSMFGDEEYVYSMVDRGVSGFILKTAGILDFERAITKILEGQQYYSEEIMGILVKKFRSYDTRNKLVLSEKEKEVLRMLCRGHPNTEIADRLCISIRTVEGYRNKLLQKTNSSNVLNLVIFALRNKIVTL
jgi:DNA-binding NarL/FixJ family response regulator